MFEKCEFCEKWVFEIQNQVFQIVNFVKKTDFKKCELCEKWDFENVNFVKNEILKMRIMRLWTCG